MIPKELLQKVRRLEIRTRGPVNDIFSGEYHSVFKGRGIEFSEVREYEFGDDIRLIDWNVTARYGSPFVKIFEEERELTVILMVDVSRSEEFGSASLTKGEIVAELCALLAFSAIKNNDKVGAIIFSDRIEKFVPPRKGVQHGLRVLRELLYLKPRSEGTDISLALEYLISMTLRKSVVFLISDFISTHFEKALRVACKKHDLIAIKIFDPREMELPDVGYITLADSETGEELVVNSSDYSIRKLYREDSVKQRRELERLFRSINLDYIAINTSESYIQPLYKFFRMRAKRFR
ncbi:MAG: DUF58 domain-containing protein [Fidelibacterota bacterium]